MHQEAEVRDRLGFIEEALEADGGELVIDVCDGTRLELAIVVGPDACIECLVPADQIEQMAAHALRGFVPNFEELIVTVRDQDVGPGA